MTRPALAADRALQVIDLLALHPTERFTLTEIARRTGINSASAHALLSAMLRAGYLQRHPTHKTYALGPALVAAGTAALEQLPGIRAAQTEIEGLGKELELEAVVTAVVGDEIIVVGRALHASTYGAVMALSQRLPLAPPFGSVFLAWSPAADIERWLERAEPPLSPDEIEHQRRVLDVVRARGYSVAFESEARRGIGDVLARRAANDPTADADQIDHLLAELAHSAYHVTTLEESRTYDVSMVAAPIFDSNRGVVASIAVSGFAPGVDASELIRISERVRGVARLATKRSLGRLPPQLD